NLPSRARRRKDDRLAAVRRPAVLRTAAKQPPSPRHLMFPLFLNVRDRLCVVIGGGSVGQRKATALLESGARVRAICLESRPPLLDSPRLEWLTEPYTAEHLSGAALVLAAGPPEVNQ